jgi:hypothetical protein
MYLVSLLLQYECGKGPTRLLQTIGERPGDLQAYRRLNNFGEKSLSLFKSFFVSLSVIPHPPSLYDGGEF